MARPAHLLTTSFFYPVGNTPAVCLTHSLPPDQDVSLLLLGCGDVRNVLFTAYADLGSGNRTVDMTCCDIETEIIARNALLYTLILDDSNNENAKNIWNLYNDILVNTTTLTLIRDQAKTLIENTETIADWNDGKYGKVLRFSSHATFSQVMRLWRFYALDPSSQQAFKEQQRKLRLGIEKARELQKKLVGKTSIGTGVRSAAPCNPSDTEESSKLYNEFWKEGLVINDAGSIDKAQYMNPMFGTLSERLVLHYGTQPLLGYHLATAYTPTTKASPLKYDSVDLGNTHNGVRAAFAQFCAYAKAFRAASTQWVIRFVNADALAFCHTLQGLGDCGERVSAGWYRDNWHYEAFVLDSHEYSSQGGRAPSSFDMIDTSNLVDHLGALNLLVAASPLLKPIPTSTVCTELLVQRRENTDQYVKSLLSGDMVTIGLLFKLTPIQYWTGATVSSNLVERISGMGGMAGYQSRYIVRWTRVVTEPIAFEPKQLSELMYRMYLDMFKDESPGHLLKMKAEGLALDQYSTYTRASLCSILQLVRKANLVDWQVFIRQYCEMITEDTSLLMGRNYLQEFYLHLYLSGLHTMPNYAPDMDGIISYLPKSPLRGWTGIPPALSISMVIPHRKLALFQNAPLQKYGTPISHVMLESQYGQSYFSDVQLSFGKIKALGMRFTENYALEVEVDEKGWDGLSPLIVSVIIPTSIVLLLPDLSTQVSFALKTTPTTFKLLGELGMNLKIHESTLAGDDVFITRYRPKMKSHISIGPSENRLIKSREVDRAELKFHLLLNSEQSKATSLTTRVSIISPHYQDILRQGAEVQVDQISPYKISINFQGKPFYQNIQLPLPVLMANTKTRVARKSSYVEFIAPIASTGALAHRPDNIFPVEIYENTPILRNLDYTALDKLPILDLENKSKIRWLNPLVSDMFSDRERRERENNMSSTAICKDARVNFKDSLHTLFGFFSGAGAETGPSCTVFGLDNSAHGGMNVLIFISCLRLEMSNQSVVLDGAVVPLTTSLVPKIEPVLRHFAAHGIRGIRVDDDELLLWKHVLPAYVERCRSWKHLPSCEYKSTSKIPLSVDFGQPLLCSCGQGKFPDGYRVKGFSAWKDIKKYAVRVAISPCYSVPFVEKGFTPDTLDREKTTRHISEMMKTLELKNGTCSSCGGIGAGDGAKLLKCSGCKVAEYCSKECQKKDWRAKHKAACKTLSKLN
ncbi:hypothetical protein FQN49_003287 [Arthroderma sp. PD_2]|nr:hypothetical protein FQN49_003287 [Arthroderma sp. PD_2]